MDLTGRKSDLAADRMTEAESSENEEAELLPRAQSLPQRALQAGRGFLDVILPPRCLACGVAVDRQGTLCPDCWMALTFVVPPLCSRCGQPVESEKAGYAEDGAPCGACGVKPPAFDAARARLLYRDTGRLLVLGLKHGDRHHIAPPLAQWMLPLLKELIEADTRTGTGSKPVMLVPVPLHWRRIAARGFNQAGLLASHLQKAMTQSDRISGKTSGEISEEMGPRCVFKPGVLVRHRATPPQGSRGAPDRRRNVLGAFAVPKRHRALIRGASVILIDDVFTTGATVDAAARTLKAAGAGYVAVLCAARVLR